jgi:hypothetical protein
MISVMQQAIFRQLLRATAEATESEYTLHVPEMTEMNNISLQPEGDTRGYVKFCPYDHSRYMISYKTSK